jgi:hypothetical protein
VEERLRKSFKPQPRVINLVFSGGKEEEKRNCWLKKVVFPFHQIKGSVQRKRGKFSGFACWPQAKKPKFALKTHPPSFEGIPSCPCTWLYKEGFCFFLMS